MKITLRQFLEIMDKTLYSNEALVYLYMYFSTKDILISKDYILKTVDEEFIFDIAEDDYNDPNIVMLCETYLRFKENHNTKKIAFIRLSKN